MILEQKKLKGSCELCNMVCQYGDFTGERGHITQCTHNVLTQK